MKRYRFLIGAMVVGALLALLSLLSLSALAIRPPLTPAQPTAEPTTFPTTDYLLALPLPRLEPATVPPGLSPEEAATYARSLTYRQAGPVLTELERLRAEGLIAGYEVRPDLYGIIVKGAPLDTLEALSRQPGVAAVMRYSEDSPPACAVAATRALPGEILSLSRLAAGAPSIRVTGLGPQDSYPTIYAYVPPGNTGDAWTYFWGHAPASTLVTMRILRGGRVIATQSTTSYSEKWYSFSPIRQSCPTWGYNWSLQPGDVVEVTAQGQTVSTVIADLRAWVDPQTDTVSGRTDPGRSVLIWIGDYKDHLCYETSHSQTVSADENGDFTADFSNEVDFDRKAEAEVYAWDAGGNSTYYDDFRAHHIYAQYGFSAYLKPEVDFSATLSRAGDILSECSGRSRADGYARCEFTTTIQAGDVVSVSGGGVDIQYTAATLDAFLDPQTDQVSGITDAGRQVRATLYKRASEGEYVRTACGPYSSCVSGRADVSGTFVLSTTSDLVRGDYVHLCVYDDEGNYQCDQFSAPVIAATLDQYEVRGYWGRSGTLTVTLKAPTGAVKSIRAGIQAASGGGFYANMTSTIAFSDTIEVTDGTSTETMTVRSLTVRLDDDLGLTGNSSGGHLIAELWDFRRGSSFQSGSLDWIRLCDERDVDSGEYSFLPGGLQLSGQDRVTNVWLRDPEGHVTRRLVSLYAFTINVQKGDDYVEGYTETPHTPVTLTLLRNSEPVALTTTTSTSWGGNYAAHLSGSTPVTITEGDVLIVQTGDGDHVALTIPQLTVHADGVNNRVYGASPPNEPVIAQIRRYDHLVWYHYYRPTVADSSGNYSASFSGLYWWDCSPVSAGHWCAQPAAYYYNDAGHLVWVEGPEPQPVEPDVYESDDDADHASTYTGVQSHTFHAGTDADWVTFTVPQADADRGTPYFVKMFNMGMGLAIRVYLYDTDMNLQEEWLGYGGRERSISFVWIPTGAGTYYLEMTPLSSAYGGYCDALYDLLILPVRGEVYLPLVMRNY